MSTGSRLAGFAAVAAAVFGLALLVGRSAGPVTRPASAHEAHDAHDVRSGAGEQLPGGLMTSQDGYTLRLAPATASPGAAVPVSFEITGPDGHAVTSYQEQHDKLLHLVAVRRDLTGFQHVHPTLVNGVWSTDLSLTPGSWRVFADFRPTGGAPMTLGADLSVPGRFQPATLPPSRTAEVDGYQVTLHGDLRPGGDSLLSLRITRAGRPVTDLSPYLGAYGHLVALREGDLAYLHVHPDGAARPGPDVVFHAAVPSAGTYHLYLDFLHAGKVRTAAFTVTTGSPEEHA